LLTSVVVEFVDYDTGTSNDSMLATRPFVFSSADFVAGRKLIDIVDTAGAPTGFRANLLLQPQ
jgi:hypothetical protein